MHTLHCRGHHDSRPYMRTSEDIRLPGNVTVVNALCRYDAAGENINLLTSFCSSFSLLMWIHHHVVSPPTIWMYTTVKDCWISVDLS